MSTSDIQKPGHAQAFPDLKISDVRVLSMQLTAVAGIDAITEITYDQGHFYTSFHVVGGPPGPRTELSADELRTLLAELQHEKHQKGSGIDRIALGTLIHLAQEALRVEPSSRFDHARFGDIAKDAGDAIVAHLGLGVDVAGTVHDAKGAITFEQHVVPMKPGAFQPLSRADRASLAAALKSYIASAQPRANPLYDQLLQDLSRG
jgi:hypothetical protein